MDEIKPKGDQRKAHLLAVFNFDDLSKVGIFMNTHHIQICLKVDAGNLSKYLDEKISSFGKYVVVRVLRNDNQPLDTLELMEKAKPLAELRKGKTIISRFTSENLRYLDGDKINAITKIINDK